MGQMRSYHNPDEGHSKPSNLRKNVGFLDKNDGGFDELLLHRRAFIYSINSAHMEQDCASVFILSILKRYVLLFNLDVLMAPKFQPTRDASQRRNGKPEQTHQLQDESSKSEEEVQEIGA
ncbi:hypothetical protein HAX54_009631 [Datura stramonium]|uniref:Uncharacterized protein n=1 Tax=Datura stramonium TaxID=4076 RepID=A0ABS8TFW9_DATST|nr:hypothetical protein [Datura stramonium]